jgi:hypothetical protein
MALVVYDRVQETTTTSGTGSVTLLGAVSGFQSFAVVGNSNTTYYTITDGAQWEVGIGTYSTSGPTLARTTVLSNSNGNTSPITLSGGLAQVFVTYTAEKSVNLDASGNVTPLGTIASGTWQGTTVGVSYGGTGVTASSGANSVMLRDSNANTQINNIIQGWTSTVSAGGTTTLTVASSYWQRLTGSTTQTIQLPDATTLVAGTSYLFDNDSTGNLFITNNGGSAIETVPPGGYSTVFLESNSTSNGTWGRFGMLPTEVNWGTLSADLGGSTVSNAVWQGTTIATGYGGTGLTSFTSGGALYATSTSSLTSGTLPTTSGGTGLATYTTGDVIYASATNTLAKVGIGSTGQVLTVAGGIPTWAAAASGVTITNDTSTATALYPTFTSATSGSVSGLNVTSTKLTSVPTTGSLTAPQTVASNGLVVNSNTVSASYSIPSGSSATSTGPMTIGSGVVVTVPSGSRWVVL